MIFEVIRTSDISGKKIPYEKCIRIKLKLVDRRNFLTPELYDRCKASNCKKWEQIMYPMITENIDLEREKTIKVRQDILKLCDVFIDGRYIEEKRDITLKWCGSSNQRVIDVQKSLEQNKVCLYDK